MSTEPYGILALDVGTRRVGVATANSIARIANPLVTLPQDDAIFHSIKQLVAIHDARYLVVGLPRNLSGDDTRQTEYVRDFVQKLTAEVEHVAVVYQDEAVTSVAAEAELSKKSSYSKADIDAVAAAIILEDFLRDNEKRITTHAI